MVDARTIHFPAGFVQLCKRASRAALVLAFFAASTIAMAQQPNEGAFYSEIASGVYAHHGIVAETDPDNQGDIANLGFIVGEEAVAVIDTSGSVAVGERALAAIRDITDKPIGYVINTHMHPDHVFGNQVFAESGATVLGHEKLGAAIAARADSYKTSMAEQLGAEEIERLTIIGPDEGVAIGEPRTIDLGHREIVLTAWKTAHTDNDLTVWDKKTKTLFTGDLVFMDHIPVVDGSIRGWMEQTPDLQKIEADHVIPGHGPLDASWPEAMEHQTVYLEALAKDVREAIANGDRLQETAETAAREEAETFELSEGFRRRNATAAFAELEWE
ncbi:quinoprotein relay system zinc metallohydrolase 2 [Fulvimarina sp. MAC8]|uniref:quinoprotein relay system zinc metallohydrolase 2 n=1 Tax=Fulvimarina sp. MAC8 TaxID=3162874 RepID=UPI0032EDDBC3